VRRDKGAFESAIRCFQEAIAMDPDYALAHAGLADAFSIMALYGVGAPLTFGPLALAAAERALSLDPGLAEAHSARALVQWTYERDWSGAIASYERALAINPQSHLTKGQFGSVLVYTGRAREGVALAAAAAEAEPFNPVLSFYYAGLSSFVGQDDVSLAECDRMLRIIPDAPLSIWVKAGSLVALGRYDEALVLAERLATLLPESTLANGVSGYVAAARGDRAGALEAIQRFERQRAQRYVPAIVLADVYSALRDADATMRWLEISYEQREGFLARVFTDAGYRWLRDDARFVSLVRRMNLQPWPNDDLVRQNQQAASAANPTDRDTRRTP
jgi:serine/threonine-protein kinase